MLPKKIDDRGLRASNGWCSNQFLRIERSEWIYIHTLPETIIMVWLSASFFQGSAKARVLAGPSFRNDPQQDTLTDR